MDMAAVIFYLLSFIILTFAAAVVILPNPIHAALSLAVTMVALGFMYFQLQAHFIAGVQLIVYAGAVMVLFVMVLMLFDLKKEAEAFSGSAIGIFLKSLCGILLVSAITWGIRETVFVTSAANNPLTPAEQMMSIKLLANKLFTQYLFAFEALGVLLLLIAVGVVAVSRARGGTHARD
jgi:NADH-quinone oxidoreductase subunit J